MKNLKIRFVGLEFEPEEVRDGTTVLGVVVLKGVIEVPNRTISGDVRLIPVSVPLDDKRLFMADGDEFQDGSVGQKG